MLRKCDSGILSLLTAGLAVVSIASYINIQYLHEQLERCQSGLINCKHMQILTINNIFQEMLSFKSFIPKEKEIDFIKLESYLTSLAPTLSQETTKDRGIPIYSCRENFKYIGWPWTEGFVRENCSKQSPYESTTLILVHPVIKENRFRDVIKNVLQLFLRVIIIANESSSEMLNIDFPSNRVTKVVIPGRSGYSYGDALNSAVGLVKSTFILIAPQVGRMGSNLDVERLIHVQETTKAAIVAGAVKDIDTGKWDRGCYQAQLKYYTLKYTVGYYVSQHECLYCDYIVSPFLARKDLLLKYKFRKINYGVFRDYFIRIKNEGERILSCPDVMFYVDIQKQTELNLVNFAELWDIRRIIESDNTILWFGFRVGTKNSKDVYFRILDKSQPKVGCGATTSLAISPDCLYNLLDAIIYVMGLCKEYEIVCELEEGTLLGVMKFNHILPWERDADISFLSSEFHKMKKLGTKFTKHGIYMKLVSESTFEQGEYRGGVFYIKVHGWNIEMYGKTKLMKRHKPYTLVNLGNHWVNAPENPGLYARNRYGIEVYRHAEHWRAQKAEHGFTSYASGKFPECTKPAHHSCLDQFHADGDIQFLELL